MNISRFFIDRPIFAAVLSIVTILVGAIAYRTLPLPQYPEVVRHLPRQQRPVPQRGQALPVNAGEMPHQDRIGRIVTGKARHQAQVVAPRRRRGLVERRERAPVAPQHVLDVKIAACAQRRQRIVLKRK